jgi:hypothetical protein
MSKTRKEINKKIKKRLFLKGFKIKSYDVYTFRLLITGLPVLVSTSSVKISSPAELQSS